VRFNQEAGQRYPGKRVRKGSSERLAETVSSTRYIPLLFPDAAHVPASLLPRFPADDMSIKSDRWIRRMAREHRMIEPFVDGQVREGAISFGVSSYGYDMRVAPEFRIFTNVLSAVVDPKSFDDRSFVKFDGEVCIVPPNSFALARSVEYFRIPRNVLTICLGKSTYARCGIITNVTPFEPEWEGYVTLEISNTTPLPAKIYANEGICQVLFFEADDDDVCQTSYADKKGKYQRQTGVTLPKL
jgi:dCTP deaminase